MAAHLVLGGARSGKSAFALQLAHAAHTPVAWLATGQAGDAEMQARIARHQAERPAHWLTCEEPLDLAGALASLAGHTVVVDCLTLWVSNWLCGDNPGGWPAARAAFLQAVAQQNAPLILVGNEVGMGIVPENALARQFRDEAGWLHQALGKTCAQVTLVVAGIPLIIKDTK